MAGMIICFKGRRGAGKTLGTTALGKMYSQKGWKVYSNYSVSFAEKKTNSFFRSIGADSDIQNCVLLLDELQILFDSRNTRDKENKEFGYYLQQLRKKNVIIVGTTQFMDTLEKRIRQQLDIVCCPVIDKGNNVVSVRFFDVTSLEDSSVPDFVDGRFFAIPIFKDYDTNEIISTS